MTDARHPLTWWIWSITLAIGIAREDNSLLAIVVVGCAYLVVRILRTDAPWSRSFESGVKLGFWILIIRTSFGVLIGTPIPGRTIFRLPILPLPEWMSGIRIGGAVTQERLFSSAHEGVTLAAIIICLAAASSLTSPHRLLRVLPFAIYQFGLALVIATSLVPQFVTSISRIKDAQYLRGQNFSFKKILIPLLEESLARSLDLAASMDSRGYGSTRSRSKYRAIPWSGADVVICSVSTLSLFLPISILISVVTPFLFIKRKIMVTTS